MSEGDGTPPSRRRRIAAAIATRSLAVQVAAIVLGALGTAATGVAVSGATGDWQNAVREETQRSAAAQEQARVIYGDEAPTALRLASAEALRDALITLDTGSEAVAVELQRAEQTAFALRAGALPFTLAGNGEYALPEGGFDVSRRLVDLQQSQPVAFRPDAVARAGDDQARSALLFAAATAVVGLVAMAVAVLPRRRRPVPSEDEEGVEPPDDDRDPIPQPGAAARRRRAVSSILLGLWLGGVLLPLAQLLLSAEEQRSQGSAARIAVQLTAQIALSNSRAGFESAALLEANFDDIAATARELAALDLEDAAATAHRAVARAETAAAGRTRDIAQQMTGLPDADSGLDPFVIAALGSGRPQWNTGLALQQEQADRAETFSTWSNATVVAIALLGAAAALIPVRPRPTPSGSDD